MTQFNSTDDALSFLAEQKKKREEEASQRGDVKNNRFFLQPGKEGHIIFLDDLMFPVWEHQFWDAQNKRPIFETCIQGIEGECPGCDSENKPYFALVTTVIHLDPINKNGEKLNPRKRLLVAKTGSSERILTRQKNQGTLVSKCFWVKRSTDSKAEKTGTDIDFVKEADLENLKKYAPENVDPSDWVQPYDYKEVFKPKSVDDFRKALGFGAPIGGESDESPAPESGQKQNANSLEDLI